MSKGKSQPSAPPPPVPDPTVQANALVDAQISAIPRAAQANWDILTNPTYGVTPTTQLYENARQSVFPQEQAVRSQLAQTILRNLQSPTGISPDQQAAIDARRQLAQGNLVTALRDRSNLGGTLYGGRSALDEGRQVGELQNQFSEEDINRQIQERHNAISSAIPLLQLLFPNVNITNPQYTNPVQGADTYASGLVSQRGQDIQQQIAMEQARATNQASQNALYGSLFQGLGTVAGSFAGPAGAYAGGRAGAMAGSALQR